MRHVGTRSSESQANLEGGTLPPYLTLAIGLYSSIKPEFMSVLVLHSGYCGTLISITGSSSGIPPSATAQREKLLNSILAAHSCANS